MAENEQSRQVQVAIELERVARTLAHSTREVAFPFDSYRLLGELGPTVDHLEQVCQQLAAWHQRVVDGQHYVGEDERGDGATGTVAAAAQLEAASVALRQAADAIRAAHTANGVVRWVGE